MKKLKKPAEGAEVYAFPQHQVYLVDGVFQQTRSGPNWEGGLLTLSTCKHYLRSTREPDGWVGVWFAGFTPKINGENYLLWLGRVAHAFPSNYALGGFLNEFYPSTFAAKLASHNVVGDVYEPRTSCGLRPHEVREPAKYVAHPQHVRQELKNGVPKWHSDVHYAKGRNPAASFVFDTKYSFVFTRPVYRVTRPLYRSGWRAALPDMLSNFIEEV